MSMRRLPVYSLSLEESDIVVDGGNLPTIALKVHCKLLNDQPINGSGKDKGKKASNLWGMTSILTCTSDLEFLDYRRIP